MGTDSNELEVWEGGDGVNVILGPTRKRPLGGLELPYRGVSWHTNEPLTCVLIRDLKSYDRYDHIFPPRPVSRHAEFADCLHGRHHRAYPDMLPARYVQLR